MIKYILYLSDYTNLIITKILAISMRWLHDHMLLNAKTVGEQFINILRQSLPSALVNQFYYNSKGFGLFSNHCSKSVRA